ncbi:MAG: bifunctional phosphoribosylaminoimidazolecarboxamide formyltransferase/IMP cyclohydrolase [Tissierellia bacterium]|nr:bifunctional phosphoribosylaminoimidazolecarboxamide formyltransferase/IMP cyclohydrolase [Tissierellia bacterium]
MQALISVYDKKNIVEFARGLEALHWDLISTGGTYRLLQSEGIKVREVGEVTDFPEMLEGRVKTLHPKIHGGILYKRDHKDHVKTLEDFDITSIDMVVNNLYPFEESLKKGKSHEEMVENIDIGGPSMVRAAAKNYRDVLIVTDPKDYRDILDKLKEDRISLKDRKKLAAKAFSMTATYDSLISNYFSRELKEEFPQEIHKSYRLVEELRYGENPHQKAAFYENIFPDVKYRQLHGKELSYNNLNDMYGALKIAKVFDETCAIAVKHTNPCGIATGKTAAEAFQKAYECDDESIFGGIIVINEEIDKDCAQLLAPIFLEIIVAASFTEEALDLLKERKNIRLIEMPKIKEFQWNDKVMKETLNGVLIQDFDKELYQEDEIQVVTKRKPTEEEMDELLFAWKAVKNVASNGVVITKDHGTIGIGQGETKRSWAVEEAIDRAGEKIQGAVFASDGFFFEDTMELLHDAGIKAIIQPGGSLRDQGVIDYADSHNMTIVFTGQRHFRH